jgi:hypothetical protein
VQIERVESKRKNRREIKREGGGGECEEGS